MNEVMVMKKAFMIMALAALLLVGACSTAPSQSNLKDYCSDKSIGKVYDCGGYVKLEYNNLGGGITWLKNGTEIRCPVVGPDSMSAECKQLMNNPPTCTLAVTCSEEQNPDNETIVGGDRDAYGCIPSAGYSWCEAKQKCVRLWEESCNETQAGFTECPQQQPGPVACTMEWSPVCGKTVLNTGETTYQTFGNACTACAALKVVGYTQGECPNLEYVECNHTFARGEFCAQIYDPVCAQRDNGIRCIRAPCPSTDNVTYSNACEACKDEKVYGYVPGACENSAA
jgi:hypothetical protein